MASGLPTRIIEVLRDYLPAELDLIDTEQADGIVTPDVPTDRYWEWDRPLLPSFPAVTIAVGRARPVETLPAGQGSRLHAWYDVEVKFHVDAGVADGLAGAYDTAQVLQRLCFRYGAAGYRVLCDQKDRLQTVADPTLYAHQVRLVEVRWGPEQSQESGQKTRTAVVAVEVRKIEAR